MPTEVSMNFSIPNWTCYQFKEIGSIGNTVWSCRMAARDLFEIQRTVADAETEIYIKVLYRTTCILQCQVNFNEGSNNIKRLYTSHIPMNDDSTLPITGIVRVCYTKTDMRKKRKHTSAEQEQPIASPQMVSDLLNLLDNPDSFSDATLVCGNTKIPVHRNILSTRSPVFGAMFKTQMQEGRNGIVDIVDMEPDVLQALLKYIYSGKTDHLTHSLAGDLLFGADKYQLKELKLVCVEQLKTNLSADNVFRCLVLGDLHDKSLKVHAVDFICKYSNFSDLEKTDEWQSLLKERASLAVEVATTVVKYLQNSRSTRNKATLVRR